MTYPSGVITRQVSFGGASAVESGEPLKIQVTTKSSRSLIWRDSGYRLESLEHTLTADSPGGEVFFEVPVTDQNGWNDAETRQAIIVNSGESSHTYTSTLCVYAGQRMIRAYVIGPYPVANEPGVLDGDLISTEVDPIDGTLTVYIPGPPGADGDVVLPLGGTTGQHLVKASDDDLDMEWVDAGSGGSVPDATTTTKGKVRLAGDLAGTADAPTVPALADKANAVAVAEALAGKQPVGDYATTASLATVATTGAYSDLTGKPTIPPTPDLSGFATKTELTSGLAGKQPVGDYATRDELPDVSGLATTAYVDQTVGDIDTVLSGILGGE